MKTILAAITIAALTVTTAAAAEQTLTGKIGDSLCGATHKPMAEHAGKQVTSDRDCTLACIKKGGKYILVSDGKIYNIQNQDFAGLQEHAGHTVNMKGDVSGDTITVSSITMHGKGEKSKKPAY